MKDTPEFESIINFEEFWFEDGDIVLSVREEDANHHFRVHSPILTIASPVFGDMLSLPQPAGDESRAVILHDSVNDVSALLGALYVCRKPQTLTFDVALGILRLSHKYQIEGLYQTIKSKLLEDWPLYHSNYTSTNTSLFVFPSWERVKMDLKLIDTAERCDANELLPTAFCELACVLHRYRQLPQEIITGLSNQNLLRLFEGSNCLSKRIHAFATFQETHYPDSLFPLICPLTGENEDYLRPKTIFESRRATLPCTGSSPRAWRDKDRCVDIDLDDDVVFCDTCFYNYRNKIAAEVFRGSFALEAHQAFGEEDLDDEVVCPNCSDWFIFLIGKKTQELWRYVAFDFQLPEFDKTLYIKAPKRSLI